MNSCASKQAIYKISENLNKESTAAIVRTLLKLHKHGGATEDKLVDTLVTDENVPSQDAKGIVQSVLLAGVEFGAISKVPDIVYKLDDAFYSFLVDYYSQNYNLSPICESKTSYKSCRKKATTKNTNSKIRTDARTHFDPRRRRNKKNYQTKKLPYAKRLRNRFSKRCARRNTRKKLPSKKRRGFWQSFWNLTDINKKRRKLNNNQKTISRTRTKGKPSFYSNMGDTKNSIINPFYKLCKTLHLKNASKEKLDLKSKQNSYRKFFSSVNIKARKVKSNRKRKPKSKLFSTFSGSTESPPSKRALRKKKLSTNITAGIKKKYDKFYFGSIPENKLSTIKSETSKNYLKHFNSLCNIKRILSKESDISVVRKVDKRDSTNSANKSCSSKNNGTSAKSLSRTSSHSCRRRSKSCKSTPGVAPNKSKQEIKSEPAMTKSTEEPSLVAKSVIKIVPQKISNKSSNTKNKINSKATDHKCPPVATLSKNNVFSVSSLLPTMGLKFKPLRFSKTVFTSYCTRRKAKKRQPNRRPRKNSKRARKNYAEELPGKKGSGRPDRDKVKTKPKTKTKEEEGNAKKESRYENFYDCTDFQIFQRTDKIRQNSKMKLPAGSKISKYDLSPRSITTALGEWYKIKEAQMRRPKSESNIHTQKKRKKLYSDERAPSSRLSIANRTGKKRKIESRSSMKSGRHVAPPRKKRKVKLNTMSTTSLPPTRRRKRDIRNNDYGRSRYPRRRWGQNGIANTLFKLVKSKTPTYIFPFLKRRKRQRLDRRLKKKYNQRKYSSAYKKNVKTTNSAYYKFKRILGKLF